MSRNSVTIGIINYNAGNIYSVQNACEIHQIPHLIVNDAESFKKADALILPGVGSFQHAVATLKEMGLWQLLIKHIREDRPLLGICLGMQLLFKESNEHGVTQGLEVFEDSISHFDSLNTSGKKMKVPHMGWTDVLVKNEKSELFGGIEEPFYAYFAHSFSVLDNDASYSIGSGVYGDLKICAAVRKSNVYGVQFHPEKSAKKGLIVYKNFYTICEKWKKQNDD